MKNSIRIKCKETPVVVQECNISKNNLREKSIKSRFGNDDFDWSYIEVNRHKKFEDIRHC